MNIATIRIYPSLGRSSYKVTIEIPHWVKRLDDFIETWLIDNIINLDYWKYVE